MKSIFLGVLAVLHQNHMNSLTRRKMAIQANLRPSSFLTKLKTSVECKVVSLRYAVFPETEGLFVMTRARKVDIY